MGPDVVNGHWGRPAQVGQILKQVILGSANGFDVFFVVALVLDQGANRQGRHGETESPVGARDGGENIEPLGLAGRTPRAVLVLDLTKELTSPVDGF